MIDFTSIRRKPAGSKHLSGLDIILLSQLCCYSYTASFWEVGEEWLSPPCQAVPALPVRWVLKWLALVAHSSKSQGGTLAGPRPKSMSAEITYFTPHLKAQEHPRP